MTDKNPLELEAAVHFTLGDFATIVKTVGVSEIMSKMDEQTFWQLYKWFGDNYEFEYKRER